MNIADGEYDIDLLVLQDGPDAADIMPLVAIRYGFIPDSMDQKSELHLYQNDLVCILEAQLVERTAKSGTKSHPIIFEGVPQGQRLAHSASANMDSYFLLFVPGNDGSKPLVELRRLGSVIRVSKSRNTEKWRNAIAEWKNEGKSPPSRLDTAQDIAKEVAKPKKQQRKPELRNITPSMPKKSALALKRPPTATPESKLDIISISDFEDLESSDEDVFPVFESKEQKKPPAKAASSKPKAPVATTKASAAKSKPKPASGTKPAAVTKTNSRASINRAASTKPKPNKQEEDDMDMDDEFKDLEDQLQEVLEDSKPVDIDMSESDEDSDREYRSGPIVIKVSDESSSRPSSSAASSRPGRKPMSLRELYGGNKNEDLSSSEEE